MTQQEIDEQITEDLSQFFDDPLGYVMYNFPWDSEPALQQVKLKEPWKSRYQCEYGPDKWACEFLEELGEQIRKKHLKQDGTRAESIRFSTSSGHGIGKSVMVSWLILFILDTRPYSMGVVTANTSEQLRTKTWAELAKWHSYALTSHFWEYTNSRGNMSIYRKGGIKERNKWKCDAITARPENSESFQGLHAAEGTPFYIFDEASGIDDKIWEARFGGATDGQPMSFDFGNPTRKSGYFYENCVGINKHRYIVRQIDSRDVEITNKTLFEEWKQDWGEDHDLFKVKVRGIFPSASSIQFIPDDLVTEAMLRPANADKNDPLIIGVDVARFGDNNTIIYPRIGMDAKSWGYKVYNRLDNVQVVEKVIELISYFRSLGKNVSGLFVDGGGLGAGPVDMLRRLGYNPVDVNFGGKSSDNRYARKGDQMWGNMKDALSRLSLPNDRELKTQLIQREYGITPSGKISLESKDMMKDRGLESPDIADALSLTFAMEISPDLRNKTFGDIGLTVQSEYNPLDMKW